MLLIKHYNKIKYITKLFNQLINLLKIGFTVSKFIYWISKITVIYLYCGKDITDIIITLNLYELFSLITYFN